MSGNAKGSNFERVICRALSMWWTNGQRDDVFWRTSGSGGMATNRFARGKSTFGQQGDIQAVDPIGQPVMDAICFELKVGYGKWSVMDILDVPERGAEQMFEKFLKQAYEEMRHGGRKWMVLITKRDQRDPLVFFERDLLLYMIYRLGESTAENWKPYPCTHCTLTLPSARDLIVGQRLSAFLNHCKPSIFSDGGWREWNAEKRRQEGKMIMMRRSKSILDGMDAKRVGEIGSKSPPERKPLATELSDSGTGYTGDQPIKQMRRRRV